MAWQGGGLVGITLPLLAVPVTGMKLWKLGRTMLIALLAISILLNGLLAGAFVFSITTQAALSGLLRTIWKEFHLGQGPISRAEQNLIACWGDSLTAGTGAGFQEDYPSVLGALLGRKVFNGGVGGEKSTQIKARMLARPPGLDQGITIIWAGRNNFAEPETVKADIGTMVGSLPEGARYLVLGIIDGDYPEEYKGSTRYEVLKTLNADLAHLYGDRFVPIREYLGWIAFETERLHDQVPAALRADRIHLNDMGYRAIAFLLTERINLHAW